MTEESRENEEVMTRLIMCAVLTFLKVEVVEEVWLIIPSNAPRNEKVAMFFDIPI